MRAANVIAATGGLLVWMGGGLYLVYELDSSLAAPWHKGVITALALSLVIVDAMFMSFRRALVDVHKTPLLNSVQTDRLLAELAVLDSTFMRAWKLGICLRVSTGLSAAFLISGGKPSLQLADSIAWAIGYVSILVSIPLAVFTWTMQEAIRKWRQDFIAGEKLEQARRERLKTFNEQRTHDGHGDKHLDGYSTVKC